MKNPFKKAYIPYLIIALFGLLIFVMGITNHYLFKTVTWDYANYNFAFWDYSHFKISRVPTWPGNINFLQDHFSLTLMYFIPIYWLLDWLTGTFTLIIIQCSLILLAALYSFKIIQLKTDNFWLHTGVLAYYFLLLGRYTTFSGDVNLAVISACFIPIFIYYFEIKKYRIAVIILILSLFSRENIPIWFIFIFIVLAIQHRKEKKAVLYSMAGILISVVYFILLFKVFIPALETDEKQFSLFNYLALGANPGEVLSFILKNPIEAIKLFFINHSGDPVYDGVKAEFYLVYIISGGFVLLLRPQYFIWFIPIVAQKVLNDSFIRWGIATYYSIEVVTLLPLSVFLTLSFLKSRSIQNALTILLCVVTLGVTIHKLNRMNNQVPWTLTPSKVKIYDNHFFKAPFNIKKVNRLLKSIPPDAKVSASNVIAPHLAQRQFIYFFPAVHDAEYIIFSVFDDYYLMSAKENDKHRNNYLNSPEWEIIEKEYPVFLLKKRTGQVSKDQISNSIVNKTDTLNCNFELVDQDKNNILFSDLSKADTASHMNHEYYMSSYSSVCLTPENPFSQGIPINDIKKVNQIEISVWTLDSDNSAAIVLDNKHYYYRKSTIVETTDDNGWEKITLTLYNTR